MSLDLKGIVKSAVKVAFDLTTDAQKSAVLVSDSGGVYDPESNTYGGGTTSYVVNGIFFQSREQQMAEDSSNKASFLIQQVDLLAAGVLSIKEADTLVINAIVWQIEFVSSDPVSATWTLRLRK